MAARALVPDSSFKDIYARFSYRINLERDSESRRSVQAAGQTGPHDHTYLNLGTFYLHGKSQQGVMGADASGNPNLFVRAGALLSRRRRFTSFNYRTFNLFGLYMFAKDTNLLPVDASGALIPLPLGSPGAVPMRFISSIPAKFNGGFLEADYLVLPWIMAIGRWDGVNSSADRMDRTGPAGRHRLLRAATIHTQSFHSRPSVPDSPEHQGHRLNTSSVPNRWFRWSPTRSPDSR